MNEQIDMVAVEVAAAELAAAIEANNGANGTLKQASGAGFLNCLGKNRRLVERSMVAPAGSMLRSMYEKNFPLYRRLFAMIDAGAVSIPAAK